MKQFKSLSVLATLLGASLMLTSCGGPSGQTGGSQGEAKGGTTEIVIWHAMKGANGDAMQKLIDGFNGSVGKEKNIHATGVFQGTEITSKLKIAAKEADRKNMPDITQTVGLDIPTVLRIPGLVKAEDQLKADTSVKKADFYEPLLRAFSYKGELVGLPISTSTILLYYNKAALQEAGVQPPKTLDEMAQILPKLLKKDGDAVKQDGLNVKLGRYALVNFLVSQKPDAFVGNNEGGRSGDMTQVTFDQDGTLHNFLTKWEAIVKTGAYQPIENNANEEFATGLHAMAILSSSRIGAITKLMGGQDKFGVAFLPKVNAGDTSGAAVGGSALCMYDNKDEAKKAAAWEFIKYATSAPVQAEWSQNTGYLPAHVGSEALLKDFFAKNPAYQVPLEQMKASNPNAQEPFDMVGWKVDGKLVDILTKFGQGQLSVEETEKQVTEAYNKALQEFQRSNRS